MFTLLDSQNPSAEISIKSFHDRLTPELECLEIRRRKFLTFLLHHGQQPDRWQGIALSPHARDEKDNAQIVVTTNDIRDSQFSHTLIRHALDPFPIQVKNFPTFIGW